MVFWICHDCQRSSTTTRPLANMSPFTIKKNKKNTGTVLRIIGGSSKPTYKKHRDDEDNKGFPESDTGSGSDSEGGESSSSVSSVSIQQERRITRTRRNGGKTITKKTKTDAANMVVGKIAEALASSVIAAAIVGKKDKKSIGNSGKSKHRRRDEEDEDEYENEVSDDEEYDNEAENEESDGENEDNIDDTEDDEENSDDEEDDSDEDDEDDDEDDDDDEDYDSDDDDDDDYFSDDDDDSDDSSEAEIARHKKNQKEMEQRCEKNKKKLAEIKETIQSLTATMSANASSRQQQVYEEAA